MPLWDVNKLVDIKDRQSELGERAFFIEELFRDGLLLARWRPRQTALINHLDILCLRRQYLRLIAAERAVHQNQGLGREGADAALAAGRQRVGLVEGFEQGLPHVALVEEIEAP